MSKGRVKYLLLVTLAACGGRIETLPDSPSPDSSDEVLTVHPGPSDAGNERDAFIEPEPDLSAFVCTTIEDGGPVDIACDTSTHQFWYWCPESACLTSVGCDHAIKDGMVHAGNRCMPLAGQLGVVNAK